MKGIILAGGSGTRLYPLTKITSKQLLPVYDKPMIFFPLDTFITAGIKEILVIVAPEHAGHFLNLLGDGSEFGVKISFAIQREPNGIAQAFLLGENFIGKDSVALILGDNIFEDNFSNYIKNFESGAQIFVREVHDPKRFGVIEFDKNKKVLSLEEKPKNPKSNFAQTGLYLCDNSVIEKTKKLSPSPRGELEITDVMKKYLAEKTLTAEIITKKWFDCGTHESLFFASEWQKNR